MSANDMTRIVRRLNDRSQEAREGIDELMDRQAHGEKADGAEFLALVQKRTVTDEALQAQLKLDEKPIKTIMSEVR